MKVLGLDNGVTGSYCILDSNYNIIELEKTPVYKYKDIFNTVHKQRTYMCSESILDTLEEHSVDVLIAEKPATFGMKTVAYSGIVGHYEVCTQFNRDVVILSSISWKSRFHFKKEKNKSLSKQSFLEIVEDEKHREFVKKNDADAYWIARYYLETIK